MYCYNTFQTLIKQINLFKNLRNMLTDQQIYLCSQFTSKITECSNKFKLGGIPKNMLRISHDRLITCDPCQQDKKTKIIQLHIKHPTQQNPQHQIYQQRVIEQFDGIYTSWDFQHDNYVLLLNKQGDFLFYNLITKSIQQAQKQHPGLYYDANVMHTNQHFVTCGGSFKNQFNNTIQRIIKVWEIDHSGNLMQKSRINTGHKKAIQNSFLINKSTIVSLSSDKSIRLTNLTTQQISNVLHTDIQLLSGCQIDYNTIIVGGNSRNIKLYDVRSRKQLNINPKINQLLVHVVNFTRFTANTVLVSNINQVKAIDLRTWQLTNLGSYKQGQVNSQILTMNTNQFIIGNRQKSIQLWKAQ